MDAQSYVGLSECSPTLSSVEEVVHLLKVMVQVQVHGWSGQASGIWVHSMDRRVGSQNLECGTFLRLGSGGRCGIGGFTIQPKYGKCIGITEPKYVQMPTTYKTYLCALLTYKPPSFKFSTCHAYLHLLENSFPDCADPPNSNREL